MGTGARGIRKLLEQTSTQRLQDALFFAIRMSHWVQTDPHNVEFAAYYKQAAWIFLPLAKANRRTYTAEYNQRILEAAEAAAATRGGVRAQPTDRFSMGGIVGSTD